MKVKDMPRRQQQAVFANRPDYLKNAKNFQEASGQNKNILERTYFEYCPICGQKTLHEKHNGKSTCMDCE